MAKNIFQSLEYKPEILEYLALAKIRKYLNLLAEWTGLEPATPGVTGRYSNQLNYHSAVAGVYRRKLMWWVVLGSNQRPLPCEGSALPTETNHPEQFAIAPSRHCNPLAVLFVLSARERLDTAQ